MYTDPTFPTIFFRAFTRIACVCGIMMGTPKRAEGMKQKRTRGVFNGFFVITPSASFEYLSHPLELPSIWRIPQGNIHPGSFFENRFSVRKRLETVLAMITPHTTFSNSAKRKIRIQQVHNTVVDTAAAELNTLQYSLARALIRGKVV